MKHWNPSTSDIPPKSLLLDTIEVLQWMQWNHLDGEQRECVLDLVDEIEWLIDKAEELHG